MSNTFKYVVTPEENYGVNKNWEDVLRDYLAKPAKRLEECPRVELEGHEYAVLWFGTEQNLEGLNPPPIVTSHYWTFLAVAVDGEREADGRMTCVELLCTLDPDGSWAPYSAFEAYYEQSAAPDDMRHLAWDPETGKVAPSAWTSPELLEHLKKD